MSKNSIRVLFAFLGTSFLLDLLFFSGTLEDAFITFRYSVHLADGYGLGAWNLDGSQVEGYSCFLYMLLLALGEKLGIGVEHFSKLLGIGAHLAAVALFWFAPGWLSKDNGRNSPMNDGDVYRLAAFYLAGNLSICWYAVSGMETTCFMLLVAIAFVVSLPAGVASWVGSFILATCLITMRPEGVLFAALPACLALWVNPQEKNLRSRVWFSLAGVGILLAGLTVFRLIVFGDPLPNTYYAKAGGTGIIHLLYGLRYSGQWVLANLPWILCIGATLLVVKQEGMFSKPGRRVLFLLGFFLLYLLYIVKVGGDNYSAFPHWRHMAHIAPLVALLGGMGLVALFPNRRRWRWLIAAFALLFFNVVLLFNPSRPMGREIFSKLENPQLLKQQPPGGYIQWMKEISGPKTVIATSMAGILPFEVEAIYIDILGLNNHHIARNGTFDPKGPPDSKTDMNYVMDKRPDIIDGYLSVKEMQVAKTREDVVYYRRNMLVEMLDHPVFKEEYLFLVNGPYQHADRAIFLRKDFWEQHSMRDTMQVMPVTRTVLYKGLE